DGIRDKLVTGVQTCALPILPNGAPPPTRRLQLSRFLPRPHLHPGESPCRHRGHVAARSGVRAESTQMRDEPSASHDGGEVWPCSFLARFHVSFSAAGLHKHCLGPSLAALNAVQVRTPSG